MGGTIASSLRSFGVRDHKTAAKKFAIDMAKIARTAVKIAKLSCTCSVLI
jgi:hypothetical protein